MNEQKVEQKKKMSTKKKVLIGVGIAVVILILAAATCPTPQVIEIDLPEQKQNEPAKPAALVAKPKPTGPKTSFGNGTHKVGSDIAPGTYKASDTNMCYWERLSNFSGNFDGIISNNFVTEGDTIVTIEPSDAGFKSQNCGTWKVL